jgi:protein DGCR14
MENDKKVAKKPVGSVAIIPAHLKPFLPPPPAIPLEEDDYIDGISKIIKRDFFPDLDKLKVQNELLEAINNSEQSRVSEKSLELAHITGQTKASLKPNISEESEEKEVLNTDLTLDKFQTKYTSEDNASFSSIIEKQNLLNSTRQPWFYDTDEPKAILGTEERLLLDHHHISKPVLTWKHTVKSALMYGPKDAPLTLADLPKTRSAPKELKHSATRFQNPDTISVQLEKNDTKVVWNQMAKATPGLFDRGSETPRISGYKYVPATPEIKPGVDINPSELMTWGVIDATPILADSGKGPSFSMAATPQREVIGNKLSEKAAKAIRQRQGTDQRFKTPLRGVTPAVLALKKSLHGTGGMGQALRATYNTPKVIQSPRFTPQRTPTTTPRKVSERVSKKTVSKSNITDDLLNI